MADPVASRPDMPGYGILESSQGSGLLPWSWARERLDRSRNYWLCTTWPDGRPHVAPVWGVWHADELWFSCGLRARKARNLARDPRCSAATEDPEHPVVLNGTARVIRDAERIAWFSAASNAKYDTDYAVSFLDPEVNGTYVLRPRTVVGLIQADFVGSPTRWAFEA